VGGRQIAGRDRGGGESIPALHAALVRLTVSALTLALAIALAVYPALHAGDLSLYILSLGAAALCLLPIPLLRFGRGAWPPLFLLALEYALAESFADAPVSRLPVYAAGLIVLAELLFWAAELPFSARIDRGVVGARLLSLVLVASLAAALASLTLLAGELEVSSALLAAVLGVLAASTLLATPWLLMRERGRRS
jgi:hypothetical protein